MSDHPMRPIAPLIAALLTLTACGNGDGNAFRNLHIVDFDGEILATRPSN